MHLVDHEQGAKSSDLAQMQVRSSRNRLIGCDITREPATGVWLILCSAQTEIVAQCGPPGRACERKLSRGTTQQTRSMIPASISRAAAITGRRDLPPPGVTPARMSVMSDASPRPIAATRLASVSWCARNGVWRNECTEATPVQINDPQHAAGRASWESQLLAGTHPLSVTNN